MHESIDILWITAGLGCDGDTIAMTAATVSTYGRTVRALRAFTKASLNKEPEGRVLLPVTSPGSDNEKGSA
jgi:hypothetical protein